MKLQYRLGVALSAGTLIAQLLAPAAYADTTIDISGNGAGSNNTVNVTNNSSLTLNQTNNTTVNAVVISSAKTGGNEANDNNGASVSIETGNATAKATLNVTGGSNTANITGCGCNNTTDNVTISGNDDHSNNSAKITNGGSKSFKQKSNTSVGALILAKAKTGKNKANNNNVSNGTVNVTTGNSNSTTNATVNGGSNNLTVTP